MSQLLSNLKLNPAGNARPLDPGELQPLWTSLHSRYPGDFSVPRSQVVGWHERQVDDCERSGDWRAAVFHLDQLLHLDPSNSREVFTVRPRRRLQ